MTSPPPQPPTGTWQLPRSLEDALSARVRADEAAIGQLGGETDTLWGHLQRVAALAEQLGREEGLDPALCRLAALFHDAGKFRDGLYHHDQRPEERRSVEVLQQMAPRHGLLPEWIEEASTAIEQLYRDDPDPTPLACALFDADNLDKMGPLGVAHFFVKAGLRGKGLSAGLLQRITVELTYARHAPRSLWSEAGRAHAARLAPQTIAFFHALIAQLRDHGIADLRIDTVDHDGILLDVVSPSTCTCGGSLTRRIGQVSGIKCHEIHVEHSCAVCSDAVEIRFCRPRLADQPSG